MAAVASVADMPAVAILCQARPRVPDKLNSVLIIAKPTGIERFKEFPPVIWLDSGRAKM